MSTLSVVLIVKNEAKNLEDCLKSVVEFASEIIVYDTGSTDNTVEIAKKYTQKVILDNDWQGFGKARQKAQSHAQSDWVLMLDADERVTEDLRDSIIETIIQNQMQNVYSLSRLSICFGSEIKHCGWYPDWVTRLYPRELCFWDDALVHEKLQHSLNTISLQGDLKHYTYDNIEHYLIKSANYANYWAEEKYKNNQTATLANGVSHAIFCFIKMYILKTGFLDGKQGFLLCLLSAHSTFVKYAALWDKNNEN
jgi:(heptosyl)LPS beta-1,4-glucosyltransferase